MIKHADKEVYANKHDKDKITRILACIANLAELSIYSEEYEIFENEVLNNFFEEFINMFSEIKEKDHFADYVDAHGKFKIEVKVEEMTYQSELEKLE